MLRFHIYDVFTDRAFSGNPLAIVEGADALTTEQMQTIARQFNFSETIFVQAPQDPVHAARVRIFFPTAEIPFAGHPTIGCALHLARNLPADSLIALEEEAGLVPVRITGEDPARWAEFTAPVRPHPQAGEVDRALLVRALDLGADDLGPHDPGTHAGGPAFLYAPVRGLDALARARPIEPHWSELMRRAGVDSAYLYTADGPASYRARVFAPTAGIPEDPATGSATAILASQLLANGAIDAGTTALTLRQGVEMGRPSTLRLSIDATASGLRAVRVAGQAVQVAEGEIRIPA